MRARTNACGACVSVTRPDRKGRRQRTSRAYSPPSRTVKTGAVTAIMQPPSRSRPFDRMMVKEDRRRVMCDGRGLAGPKEDCSAMARIVRVEVGRFDYDLVGEFKFFKTGLRPSLVVRLTDDNGVEGWGQSVPIETWTYETVERVETTLRHYLASAVLGAEPAA